MVEKLLKDRENMPEAIACANDHTFSTAIPEIAIKYAVIFYWQSIFLHTVNICLQSLLLLVGQPEENYQNLFIQGFLNQAFASDWDVCIFAMYQK